MGETNEEEAARCLEKAEGIVRYKNAIRNAVKDFGKVYEPTLLPRQGKEPVVESSPTVASLKRVKKEVKTGKSKHYRKIGRKGWNSRKVAKQTKKERI